jgi:hypothetical protein
VGEWLRREKEVIDLKFGIASSNLHFPSATFFLHFFEGADELYGEKYGNRI